MDHHYFTWEDFCFDPLTFPLQMHPDKIWFKLLQEEVGTVKKYSTGTQKKLTNAIFFQGTYRDWYNFKYICTLEMKCASISFVYQHFQNH